MLSVSLVEEADARLPVQVPLTGNCEEDSYQAWSWARHCIVPVPFVEKWKVNMCGS